MVTSMPPHNIRDVCNAIIAYVRNPEITVEELMNYIKGPDFPTGGVVVRKGLPECYIRGKVEVERDRIVIRYLQLIKLSLLKRSQI